jgi:hypothetical protein
MFGLFATRDCHQNIRRGFKFWCAPSAPIEAERFLINAEIWRFHRVSAEDSAGPGCHFRQLVI